VSFVAGVANVTDSAETVRAAVADGADDDGGGAPTLAVGGLAGVVCAGVVCAGVAPVVALVVALAELSAPGAGGRDDGNRIGVMMNTTAINTSASMVRLSMQAGVVD
jgi:hypothetical protein